MKKIDIHVHCALHDQASLQEAHQACGPEALRKHLEKQRIGRAVLLSCGERSDSNVFPDNDGCCAIAMQYPQFYSWMCNISPGAEATVVSRLEHCKARGAIGIGELMINQWLDSPLLETILGAAQALELPVTFHMSPEPGFSYGICDMPGLPLLEKALRKYPNLKFVGHSQMFWLEISGDCPQEGREARIQWGHGPVIPGGRLIELFENYPNLYGDLSANSGSCAIMRDQFFGLSFLERFSDRLLFATDTVNTDQVFPLGNYLDRAVQQGRLSSTAYENICRKNAQRLYHLDTIEKE